MPDDNTVIDAFERCICGGSTSCPGCYQDGPGFGYECRRQLCKDVLAVLKSLRGEPLEPVFDEDDVSGRCGECGHSLTNQKMYGDNVLVEERYAYCPACGRAVKWK